MSHILLISSLSILLIACDSLDRSQTRNPADFILNDQLPSALFVTDGLEKGSARLPQGMTIAIQTLNRLGTPVRLETRDILYKLDSLKKYNVLLLSTASGYYDADRPNSLTFMSDAELENIRRFVRRGGVLIAGDNVGRNYPDGTDRIGIFRRLKPTNFALSEVFGMEWIERNMKGYVIQGAHPPLLTERLREASEQNVWTLVGDSILSDRIEVLAHWINSTDSVPAIVKNRYGEGTAYVLASSNMLHPANAGGEWSADRIMRFYELVIDDFHEENKLPLHLNPWPGGHRQAFCVSLNTEGKPEEYQRLSNYFKKHHLRPTYFVRGRLEEEVEEWLLQSGAALASSGFLFDNYRNLTYGGSVQDILQNEAIWDRSFTGFRFPYTMPGFWGLLALDEQDYAYESSISANNLEFFHGSVFPHNLVISNDQFSHTTGLIELAPTYHDDYHFLHALIHEQLNLREQHKKVRLYEDYLLNYWERAVKPYNGLMVFMGHPAYVGHSDTSLLALESLIDQVKRDDAWMTEMEEVVEYRKALNELQLKLNSSTQSCSISIYGPKGVEVRDLSLYTKRSIKQATARSGSVEIVRRDSISLIIFDAFGGQKVQVDF